MDQTARTHLECSCGCGVLIIEQDLPSGDVFLSYNIPAFYAYQDNVFTRLKKNWSLIWSILTGKRYELYELIIIDNNKLQEFKSFVGSMRDIKEEKE
jgi:hypothetical protein